MSTTTDTPHIPSFTLGDRLRKALEIADIGHAEMAVKLDVARTTVSNYIHGRTQPSRATIIAWSMATGVPAEWLLFGEEAYDDDGTPRIHALKGSVQLSLFVQELALAA